jgi:uncharacterized membrane protein YbhN (UPF0104 family)
VESERLPPRSGLGNIIGLVIGAAALSAVVAASVAWGDRAEFERILSEAHPWWLVVGVLLQAATYLMPAGGWWAVLRRAGRPAGLWELYSLALVQLFTNQALPVGGMAGLVVVLSGFDQRGVPRPVGLAAMLVDQFGYLISYNLAILGALAWFAALGLLDPVLLGVGLLAVAIGAGIGAALVWATSPGRALPAWVARSERLSGLARDLLEADHGLVRDPRLLAWSAALRFGNVALDAATTWACLGAVGQHVAPTDAAAAFVVASVGRSLGLVPGGLGTYEGSSIAGLVLLGVPLEPALAATLLFRLLSFWLPMVPGLVLGGRLGHSVRGAAEAGPR